MKIAFVGKGGSGKTTLSALFARHLAAAGATAAGEDLTQQIDPDYVHGPTALDLIPA